MATLLGRANPTHAGTRRNRVEGAAPEGGPSRLPAPRRWVARLQRPLPVQFRLHRFQRGQRHGAFVEHVLRPDPSIRTSDIRFAID